MLVWAGNRHSSVFLSEVIKNLVKYREKQQGNKVPFPKSGVLESPEGRWTSGQAAPMGFSFLS